MSLGHHFTTSSSLMQYRGELKATRQQTCLFLWELKIMNDQVNRLVDLSALTWTNSSPPVGLKRQSTVVVPLTSSRFLQEMQPNRKSRPATASVMESTSAQLPSQCAAADNKNNNTMETHNLQTHVCLLLMH